MTGQTAFRAGLLNPSHPVPDGLSDAQNRPARRRYGVYRNNVTVSLRDALAEGFPAIVSLIGRENFDHVARAYVRQAPPTSPLMMLYGAGFPEFLSSVQQLKQIPYLADVARIDLAMRQSYHAADSTGIAPTALQALDEPALLRATFAFAPAMSLLRSDWPVGAIWHYTLRGGERPAGAAQDVLILRPEFDPEPFILGPGAGDVLAALQSGTSFGHALEAAPEAFDLGRLLDLLLRHHAIIGLN
ncbi:putative DNA-binding domain-containing protein [Marivita sp. S0852]|uniref:HvfC/BufC family peptide modification chaperone n=1 Tax=Marivita sp. S0852 TaxID=3373893 RepID=UPI003982ADAD